MKKIPILKNHGCILPVLGFIEPSLELENLLKGGTVTLGGCYLKHKDGGMELLEVSVLPSFKKLICDKPTESNEDAK